MQEKSGYILWLPSWYPNRNDYFDGDFIKRHAEAAAQHYRIHVIFVTGIPTIKSTEEEQNSINNLSEHLIYFVSEAHLIGKIRKQLRWSNLLHKAVKDFISKNGKPICIHIHVPWKSGIIGLYLKKRFGIPYLVTEHLGIYNQVVPDNYYQLPTIKQYILKEIFKKADAFVSVSEYLANKVNEIIPLKRIVIIRNVVDTALFFCQELKELTFTFIHVSNMVPLKNVGGILDALNHLVNDLNVTDIRLVLIGNKNDKYIERAEKLGLAGKYVQFRGEIPYTAVAEEMRKAHCFILNSEIENSPCVISEALCSGLPIISTNVGGIPELFNKESDGILIEPNDAIALANAMKKIKDQYNSYDLKTIAASAAIKFSYSNAAKKFEEIYDGFQTE